MPVTRILWLFCTCLGTLLVLTSAQFAPPTCPVSYKGEVISETQWQFGLDINFEDTSAPGLLEILNTENIADVIWNPDQEEAQYVDFTWILGAPNGTVEIALSDLWNNYEENEDSQEPFQLQLEMKCLEVYYPLPLVFVPSFTNNHPPQFENQNNGEGYSYLVAMPFPRGVSITAAYNAIYVFDVDILASEVIITVELENDVDDNFEVSINENLSINPSGDIKKKRFFVDLKAKNQLDLKEPVDLILKATDEAGLRQFATVPIKIDIDVANSDPLPSQFSSNMYSTEITSESTSGSPLTTDPAPMQLQDVPEASTVVFTIQSAPGQPPVPEGMFSASSGVTNSEVILTLVRLPEGEELNIEVFVFQLEATVDGGVFVATTIIHVDQVSEVVVPVTLQFDNTVYSTQVSDTAVADEPLATPYPIKFVAPPVGNVIITLEATADDSLGFIAEFVRATYESEEVKLVLVRPPTDEEREMYEVLVMSLKAELEDEPTVTAEAILQVDLPASAAPPPPLIPGTFDSLLYVAEITDPEMAPEVLPTNPEIVITEPPAGQIQVELQQAPGGAPFIADLFSVSYSEDTGGVTLRLLRELYESDLENNFLIMQLKASQEGNTDFNAATIIHVALPTISTCTTLFPTEPPICPTCPPCLPPTTLPPTSITLVGDPYIASKPAGELGALFTVLAEITGERATAIYGLVTDNENILNTVSIDITSGVVTLNTELAPGHYEFEVTATHSENEETDTGKALLDIRSTALCDDEPYFPYALITVTAPEATENANLLPGDAIPNFDCYYSIYYERPITGWFTVDEMTGTLSISAAADVENTTIFTDPQDRHVMIKMQMLCDPVRHAASRLQEEMSTRQEMIVIVNLTPVNEFLPEFVQPITTVGYPVKSLARQLLPGPIATLQASDEDFGDSLSYALEFVSGKFKLDSETGDLYPVDGSYVYMDTMITVKVTDVGGLTSYATVQIRHVTNDQVAVISVSDATLADVDRVIAELDSQLNGAWGSIKSGVLAEDLGLKYALNMRSSKEAAAGGLVMVVYALDDNSERPKSYSELKSLLGGFSSSEWVISLVQTWEEAADFPTGGGGGGNSGDSGLEAAVIALGVLVGLLLFAIILILYFTIFRRKQKEKMLAKTGFKNRTSFSKQGISAELGKPNGLHPDWKSKDHKDDKDKHTTAQEDQDEHDERRKSMVTFSDEPEVIPVETERL